MGNARVEATAAGIQGVCLYIPLAVVYHITKVRSAFMALKPSNQPPLRIVGTAMFIVVGAVIAVIIGYLPELINPQYFGLMHKSEKWYADFTSACDSVIAKHPIGTNQQIWIPVTDPTIPKTIKDVHPLKVMVRPEGVWMLMVSQRRAGFGLCWEPQSGNTNVWILQTIAEGKETVLYKKRRGSPLKSAPFAALHYLKPAEDSEASTNRAER